METKSSSFKKDLTFSERKEFKVAFDYFYKSKEFLELLKMMRKRGIVEPAGEWKRKDDPKFIELAQDIMGIDVIMPLSCGGNLQIDEKVSRHTAWANHQLEYPVEVVCNPNKGGKHDGWGYHDGIVIIHARSNPAEDGFVGTPLVYRISEKFINEVIRNKKYKVRINAATDGLYQSGFIYVPTIVLRGYWP